MDEPGPFTRLLREMHVQPALIDRLVQGYLDTEETAEQFRSLLNRYATRPEIRAPIALILVEYQRSLLPGLRVNREYRHRYRLVGAPDLRP